MGNLQTVSSPRYGRRHAWLAAAVMAIGVCLLALPSLAEAGSYHDFLCRIPYGPTGVIGRPAPAEGVTYATSGQYVYANTGCGGGGEGSLHAQMLGNVQHSAGDGAKDTFNVPAGLEVAGFIVWRYEADGPEGADAAPVSDLYYYDPGAVAVQTGCAQSLKCSARGVQGNPLDPENAVEVGNLNKEPSLSGVTAIQWIAECGGSGACPESGTEYSSQYEVYAADIDLVDNTPPSVSGVSGPLVAGGTLSGNASVSFGASDGQSGVYGGSLVVDGKTVVSQILNTNGGACESLNVTNDGQRSFDRAKPCASSLSAGLSLNTSTLAAGAHSLELIVEDAAGNQTIAYNGTITVAGPPSGSGTGPTGGSTSGSGTGSGTGSSPGSPASSATDSVTNVAIGPSSPVVLRGAPNGTNASDQATLTARWAKTAKSTLTGNYGVRQPISGRLTTSAGQPISGALIDVYATPGDQGAQASLSNAGVRTGPNGEWSLTLPADNSSCALRFVYHSHVNDTVVAATATLTLRVHAGIALRIVPRVTSVGHRIYFSGVLHGTPIPPGGKQLVLEASSGKEWVQFDTPTTNAKGRYHASYRFKFPGPVTYRFRVLCPHEADFPFQKGTSNVVDVHER
jgi:hypothetical protein